MKPSDSAVSLQKEQLKSLEISAEEKSNSIAAERNFSPATEENSDSFTAHPIISSPDDELAELASLDEVSPVATNSLPANPSSFLRRPVSSIEHLGNNGGRLAANPYQSRLSRVSMSNASTGGDDISSHGYLDLSGVDQLSSSRNTRIIRSFSNVRDRFPAGTKAVVDCAFKAQSKDQLTLREREVILLLHSPLTDWWKGRTKEGLVGWFPASHVHALNYRTLDGGFRLLSQSNMLPQTWRELHAGRYEEVMKVPLKEQKRQEAIYELYCTESRYVSRMETVVNNILLPIREKNLLNPNDIQVIFSNIENILNLNQYFLSIIEAKYENPSCLVVDTIGDAFLMINEYLKLYSVYGSNREKAFKLLEVINGSSFKRRSFKKFITSCEKKQFMRGSTFKELLTLPIQRICKYPILIKTLLENTETTHADYAHLSRALTRLEVVVSVVNDFVHQSLMNEALEKFRTDFSPLSNLFWSPSRKLVHFGEITVKHCHIQSSSDYFSSPSSKYPMSLTNTRLQFILFNDICLVARHGKRRPLGSTFKYVIDVIPCDRLYVVEADGPSQVMQKAGCRKSTGLTDNSVGSSASASFKQVLSRNLSKGSCDSGLPNEDAAASEPLVFHLLNPGNSEYCLEVAAETNLGIHDHLRKMQKSRGLDWISILREFQQRKPTVPDEILQKAFSYKVEDQGPQIMGNHEDEDDDVVGGKQRKGSRKKSHSEGAFTKSMAQLLLRFSMRKSSARPLRFNVEFPDTFGPADPETLINVKNLTVSIPLYFRHESEYLYMIRVQEQDSSYCIFKTFDDFFGLHANLLHQLPQTLTDNSLRRLPYFPIENLMISEHLMQDRQAALKVYLDRLLYCARVTCKSIMDCSVFQDFFRSSSDLLPIKELSREWVIRKCLDISFHRGSM